MLRIFPNAHQKQSTHRSQPVTDPMQSAFDPSQRISRNERLKSCTINACHNWMLVDGSRPSEYRRRGSQQIMHCATNGSSSGPLHATCTLGKRLVAARLHSDEFSANRTWTIDVSFPPLEVSAKRQILYGNILAIKTVSAICCTAELANITSSTYVGAIIAAYSCMDNLLSLWERPKLTFPRV